MRKHHLFKLAALCLSLALALGLAAPALAAPAAAFSPGAGKL